VVEFSDKPSSGAQVIDLEKPNVADTLPAELVGPSSSASATSTEGAPADLSKYAQTIENTCI